MRDIQRSSHSGHAALRGGRRSIPGQAYLVTTATAFRRRWFDRWPIAVAVARELGGIRLWHDNHAHAWVLMPDHLHILLTLGSSESLSHLMGRVKAVSARAGCAAGACDQPFWASGFHDHALRDDEHLAIAARYVVGNPVRAGLVDNVWAWPFWDSDCLSEPGVDDFDVPLDSGRGCRRSCNGFET